MVAAVESWELLVFAVRTLLRAVAIALGSVGVFCAYRYVTGDAPHYLSYATGCLVIATGITMAMERSKA